MGYGITLRIWGDLACFTQPVFKAERVSYDMITPSATRGILQSIYWKPAVEWVVDRIHILNQIEWETLRRNERSGRISAANVKRAMSGDDVKLYEESSSKTIQQRSALILRNVNYAIECHFEMTPKAGATDTAEKHYNIIRRRMSRGQFFSCPYLGCREFAANFELLDKEIPRSYYYGQKDQDFGFMLYDIDFSNNMTPIFYHARAVNGIVDVQKCLRDGGSI